MEMILRRFKVGKNSTIGELTFGSFKCYTLENLKEGIESNKDYRIPQGIYNIYWRVSPSKGPKIHVYNDIVPKERYIMIHSGNTEDHTLGCILLGKTYSDDFVGNSKQAVQEFEELMKKQNLSDIKLKIINDF